MDTIQLHSLFDEYLLGQLDLAALEREILPWLPQLFEHRDDAAARLALEVDSLVDQIQMGEANEDAVRALLLHRRTASLTFRSPERSSEITDSQSVFREVPFTPIFLTVLDPEEWARRPSTSAQTRREAVSA